MLTAVALGLTMSYRPRGTDRQVLPRPRHARLSGSMRAAVKETPHHLNSSDGPSQVDSNQEGTLYLDPFIRSFMLGAALAGLTEFSWHINWQMLSMSSPQIPSLSFELAGLLPLGLISSTIGMSTWMALYGVEVWLLLNVLKHCDDDNVKNAQVIANSIGFTRRLVPGNLDAIKAPLLQFRNTSIADLRAEQQMSPYATATSLTAPSIPSAIPLPPLKPIIDLQRRRMVLYNQWYPVALAARVADEPVEFTFLDQALVAFRDEHGVVHVVGGVCPHRGAPLGKGWVDHAGGHKCLVCPYHGWSFDGDGKLRDVPAEEVKRFPLRPLIPSYSAVEQGGLVWLYYGDKPASERPPLPLAPQLTQKDYHVVWDMCDLNVNHSIVMDSLLDVEHHGLGGDDSLCDGESVQYESCTRSSTSVVLSATVQPSLNSVMRTLGVTHVDVKTTAQLPAVAHVSFDLPNDTSATHYYTLLPLSSDKTRVFHAHARNFARSPVFDFIVKSAMNSTASLDKEVVERTQLEPLGKAQAEWKNLREQPLDMGEGMAVALPKGLTQEVLGEPSPAEKLCTQ